MNDNVEDASSTAKWIIDNLGPNIPLHLVAYHPAFRYTKKRTSIEVADNKEVRNAKKIKM